MASSRLMEYLLENPMYSMGKDISGPGTSTAPVQSTIEGIARALQGGIGGLMQGYAMGNAKNEQTLDQKTLSEAMTLYRSDPDKARAMLASRPKLSDTTNALLMQDIGYQKQIDLMDYKSRMEREEHDRDMAAFGLGTPPGAGGGGAGGGAGGGYQNNFGNIRVGGGQWKGAGVPHNGFETFDTPQAGARAMSINMDSVAASLAKEGKPATLANIIGIWAPPKENDTNAYIRTIAEETGINPGAPLDLTDPVLKAGVMHAMARLEKGAALPASASQGLFENAATGNSVPTTGSQATGAPAQQIQPGATAGTVNYMGLEIPKADLAATMMIRDKAARQKAIADLVRDASRRSAEGVPLERIGNPDGTEIFVPRERARNMVSHPRPPQPGTEAGDVHVLRTAPRDSPEWRQAYARVAQPKVAANGQLISPDMSEYGPPAPTGPHGRAPADISPDLARSMGFDVPPGTPTITAGPEGQYAMAEKLRKELNDLPSVKDYRTIAPIYASLQQSLADNTRVGDLDFVYGIAKILDPESVVRDSENRMIVRTQSLNDQVKAAINSITGTGSLSPDLRQKLLDLAGRRVGGLKGMHDAAIKKYSLIGSAYKIPESHFVIDLTPSEQLGGITGFGIPSAQRDAPPMMFDLNGKPIR